MVDVGAHQGLFSIEAAHAVGATGRMIAIEPCPPNLSLLKRNIAANGLANVTALALAAMDFKGSARLFTTTLVSGGQSLVFNTEERGEIPVQADTLDGILAGLGASRPDLVKIDVEGAAPKVLAGAERVLAAKPRLVLEAEGGPKEVEKVRRLLEGKGYRVECEGAILHAEAVG